jgi:hypothetical protein
MRSIFRVAAVLAAATIPIIGLTAGATAANPKPKPKPAIAQISVTVSPNPLIETATSNIAAVIQVECNPAHCANKSVTISSTQLTARCVGPVVYETLFNGSPTTPVTSTGSITLVADNDGNTTVIVTATNCAPGSALVTADLDVPPFNTAVTKLVVLSPTVTPQGLKGYPANEVEVGDGGTGQGGYGQSDVYIVFYVEAPPVYAEQTVSITSDQLTARCGLGFRWENSAGQLATPISGVNQVSFTLPPAPPGVSTGDVVTSFIDNDGNAAFVFKGSSCAAGLSTVIADVQNGGPTYSTQYRIAPPVASI